MVLAPMFSAHILSVKKTLIREEMQRQKKAVKQDKTIIIQPVWGFPGSSAGKESVCNAGDPGSIPGLGRSPGEGIGYPLQCSQASLVAQLVKNLPTMRETWVPSLGWEDPLEKGKATHSSILAWRIPWTEEPGWLATALGLHRVRHD